MQSCDQLAERHPTMEDIRDHFTAADFECLDLASAEVVESIESDGWAVVIGEPHAGVYEWCHVTYSGTWTHSDLGYGSGDAALRDALVHVGGVPCGGCGQSLFGDETKCFCERCQTSRWIRVDDRLPDDGMLVLAFCEGESEPVWLAHIDDDGQWRWATGGRCRPSHWMELPEGPRVK